MNWFLAILPLLVLALAVVTIPRVVPAVRDHRTLLAGDHARANGHGRLSTGPGPGRDRR